MITVDNALGIVLENVDILDAETIAIDDANGRILAQEIRADIDLPPFDRARMDGYALRAHDAGVVPAKLRVIGEIAAGAQFDREVGSGEAVKIFTGAPLPNGTDSVQKVEVTRANGQTVEILESVKLGQFVTPRASEVVAGQVVAPLGNEIGPAELAVLASFGYAIITVGKRPRVAVLSTGSELVPVTAKPTAAQIRNSNSYTLAGYARRAGATVDLFDTVQDTEEATRNALLEASNNRDLVITSGGVSMGDYDLVKAALKEIGAEIFFDKVIIRPGKPIVFAKRGKTCFFGLPGNPVSTSVTFNVFVRPAIRRMQGESSPSTATVKAVLSTSIKDSSTRRSYLPGRLFIEEGRAIVESLKWGGSSDLVAFMKANALIIVHEEVHEIAAGEQVDVMPL